MCFNMDNELNNEQQQYCRGMKNAAQYCHVSVTTIAKWMHSGRLKYSRPSSNILIFTKEQLEEALYGRL